MQNSQYKTIKTYRTVPAVLPPNAEWGSVGETEGWSYVLWGPYVEPYVFFLWKDGPGYSVSLLHPALECDPRAAGLTVHSDGRLLPLSPGQPTTFLGAFRMSVAWMAFYSISQRLAASFPM
jgi:hypothetical protein